MQKANFHREAAKGAKFYFYKNNLRAFSGFAVGFCFLAALPAAAAEVRFDGSYRLRFNGDTDLALDETGFLSGQRHWFEHRLRLTPKIVEIGEKGGIEIQASFDVLSGIFAGDVASNFRRYGLTEFSPRHGVRPQGFDFRPLFASLRLPVGLVQFGQMPNQWGRGMVT